MKAARGLMYFICRLGLGQGAFRARAVQWHLSDKLINMGRDQFYKAIIWLKLCFSFNFNSDIWKVVVLMHLFGYF